MNGIEEKLREIGIIPVITIDDVKDAVPLARALCEGGLPCGPICSVIPQKPD